MEPRVSIGFLHILPMARNTQEGTLRVDMPPTVGATLLPPPYGYSDRDELCDDRGSSRSLDEIGALAVLGAMVEQRRRSSAPAACELGDFDSNDDDDDDDSDVIATQRRPAVDPSCDAFMKIR